MSMPSLFRSFKRRAEYERREDGRYYPYRHYSGAIAEDCECRCGYCDTHEAGLGGREAMSIDHFRPWQKTFGEKEERKFEHLRDDPENLVHACRVCNGFKWAHWPTEDPDLAFDHEKGWIDPFTADRGKFFAVEEDGTLVALQAPGQYQIGKLRLNRPVLKKQRSLLLLLERRESQWAAVVAESPGTPHAQTAQQALQLLAFIREMLNP